MARERNRTLSVPDLNDGERVRRVAVSMSHEEFARLSGTPSEALVVAAQLQQDSLRTRILRQVAKGGPYPTLSDLMNDMRTERDNFGAHEVTHLLFSLSKSGCVKFRENKRVATSSSNAALENIEATQRGYDQAGYPVPGKQQHSQHGSRTPGTSRAGHAVGKDMTEQRHHRTTAAGGVITRTRLAVDRSSEAARPGGRGVGTFAEGGPVVRVVKAPPGPVPAEPTRSNEEPSEPGDWPELQRIRASFGERAEADARASRMADAAALIAQDDPAEAERLLAKAIALSPKPMTALEREYLRYAEEHHG